MSDYLLATALGGLVAFAAACPAILFEALERWEAPNAPLLVDVKTVWGRKLEKHEVFLVALLIHVLIGCAFGASYVFFVENGWLWMDAHAYSFLSFVAFSLLTWLGTGLLFFPLLGLGLFGRKEGNHVWTEMLASHLIVGMGVWLAVQWYQPVWFA